MSNLDILLLTLSLITNNRTNEVCFYEKQLREIHSLSEFQLSTDGFHDNNGFGCMTRGNEVIYYRVNLHSENEVKLFVENLKIESYKKNDEESKELGKIYDNHGERYIGKRCVDIINLKYGYLIQIYMEKPEGTHAYTIMN